MTSKIASLILLSFTLVACGGDKPAEKSEPKPVQAETAQSTTQAEQIQAEPPKSEPVQAEPPKADQTPVASAQFSEIQKAAAALPADTGEKRYQATCKICHDSGMLDAPKLSDKANWQNRATKGVETLFIHSAKGFNKMPAQATTDVSEAEVLAAVEYMLSKAK